MSSLSTLFPTDLDERLLSLSSLLHPQSKNLDEESDVLDTGKIGEIVVAHIPREGPPTTRFLHVEDSFVSNSSGMERPWQDEGFSAAQPQSLELVLQLGEGRIVPSKGGGCYRCVLPLPSYPILCHTELLDLVKMGCSGSRTGRILHSERSCNGGNGNVSAHPSKLPIDKWCKPIRQQPPQGVHLGAGTFLFANEFVC